MGGDDVIKRKGKGIDLTSNVFDVDAAILLTWTYCNCVHCVGEEAQDVTLDEVYCESDVFEGRREVTKLNSQNVILDT